MLGSTSHSGDRFLRDHSRMKSVAHGALVQADVGARTITVEFWRDHCFCLISRTPHRPGPFGATPPPERRGKLHGTQTSSSPPHRGGVARRAGVVLPLLIIEEGWPEGPGRSFPSSHRGGVARRIRLVLPLLTSRRGGPKGRGGRPKAACASPRSYCFCALAGPCALASACSNPAGSFTTASGLSCLLGAVAESCGISKR